MNTRVSWVRAGYAVLLLGVLCAFGGHGHTAHAAPGQPALHANPLNLSSSEASSQSPMLAVAGDTLHVVWEENGHVLHRFCRAQVWSAARSVATGEQPAIAVDSAGVAHVVFVNEFGGNYEIYYCRWNGSTWSLPRNVSNTSGISSAPAVAIAPDGTLHVVWTDNTPGYNVIYHAYWDGRYWINEPIPNAMGGVPAVAVGADGFVHVVWQDRDVPGAPYEVYYSRWNRVDWSLPENLSDSAEQSVFPAVATDGSSTVQVVWQEKMDGKYAIEYTWGRVGAWSVPERLSDSAAEGYLPCIVASRSSGLYAGWDESTRTLYRDKRSSASGWSRETLVMSDSVGVAELQLAMDADGWLHAVWVQRIGADNWDVFYSDLSFGLELPVILKHAGR